MLVPNETPEPEKIYGIALPRIVLTDYNHAYMPLYSSRYKDELRPINPAFQFWGSWLWEHIAGWVPNSWFDVEVQQQWLLQRLCGPGQKELYTVLFHR